MTIKLYSVSTLIQVLNCSSLAFISILFYSNVQIPICVCFYIFLLFFCITACIITPRQIPCSCKILINFMNITLILIYLSLVAGPAMGPKAIKSFVKYSGEVHESISSTSLCMAACLKSQLLNGSD